MKPKHGQHFLIDQRVLNRIIGYAGLTEADTVLEIGGGTGNLTLKLSGKPSLPDIIKDHIQAAAAFL
jgi:16S rRNA (adenine1518-N6/adenine1519-N6)-dimethyltransferase